MSEELAERFNIIKVLERISESSLANKLMVHVVSILHRLISYAALPEDPQTLGAALKLLERTQGLSDDVQLRALQCVMPLLTHYTIHGEALGRAYQVCFRLQATKSVTVVNAAVAIIRQLIIWLFERVLDEDAEQAAPVIIKKDDGRELKLAPYAADAFSIFQDICLLLNDRPAIFLPIQALNRR